MSPFIKCSVSLKIYIIEIISIGVIYLALVRFLSCVDQIVFLQVGQLSETFIAGLTLKGSFPTMDAQVHLRIKVQVGELL